jgi:hypothetical protein
VEGDFLREMARDDVLELIIINPRQYDMKIPILAVKTKNEREQMFIYLY